MARMYEEAWEIIKKTGKVTLSSPKRMHARVIKAIIKEKDRDIVFKLECSENAQKARIESTSVDSVLKIKLIKSTGLDEL